jgi:hypothetical protein
MTFSVIKWRPFPASTLVVIVLSLLYIGCSNDAPPDITPPMPRFVASSQAPDPVEHGIYADVDPTRNAIWIEWYADTTHNTTGYLLFRSSDSTVGEDGLLRDSIVLGDFETSNDVQDPLPTSFRDTTNIQPGGVYYYQLRAFYRSPTGTVTNSTPTHPGLSSSYMFEEPIQQVSPVGTVTVPDIGLNFVWHDDSWRNGGDFQIIVQRDDTKEFVLSAKVSNAFGSVIQTTYPTSSPALIKGVPYVWRVKRLNLARPGGFSSPWYAFQIE